MPQKGQKQVTDIQRDAPTPLLHLVQLHTKVK